VTPPTQGAELTSVSFRIACHRHMHELLTTYCKHGVWCPKTCGLAFGGWGCGEYKGGAHRWSRMLMARTHKSEPHQEYHRRLWSAPKLACARRHTDSRKPDTLCFRSDSPFCTSSLYGGPFTRCHPMLGVLPKCIIPKTLQVCLHAVCRQLHTAISAGRRMSYRAPCSNNARTHTAQPVTPIGSSLDSQLTHGTHPRVRTHAKSGP